MYIITFSEKVLMLSVASNSNIREYLIFGSIKMLPLGVNFTFSFKDVFVGCSENILKIIETLTINRGGKKYKT